jgi:uncharacterized membrane protein YoaT (DUF817 family)
MSSFVTELWIFGWRNALSCIFPAAIFLLLALSHLLPPGTIPRYDFMLVACLVVQALMMVTGLETRDELLVICLFHILGLAMELYKVHMGSWSYPEAAWTKIGGVPLYSGFMYASVASYMCQAWRRMHLRLKHWPQSWVVWSLAAAIYLNFFSHHYLPDVRWILLAIITMLFVRPMVRFKTIKRREMPVALSFLLIGIAIWVAENAATYLGAWKYTYQHKQWQMVSLGKVSSWTLMAIVSYIIVAQLKTVKYGKEG